jgi:hypothetical protein
VDAAGLDGLHGGTGADVGAAAPEDVGGDVGELGVDLWHGARAGLDEMEGDFPRCRTIRRLALARRAVFERR